MERRRGPRGAIRQFDTPPLATGGRYTYDIKARWNENGHEMTQSQNVTFNPGANVILAFPIAPSTSKPAPAVNKG